jgi:hypothetical protein
VFLIGGGGVLGFGNYVCVSVQFFLGCEIAWLFVCERWSLRMRCETCSYMFICLKIQKWQMGLEFMQNS